MATITYARERNIYDRSSITFIFQRLKRALNKDIRIYGAGPFYQAAHADGKFHVFFCASPSILYIRRFTPEVIWGSSINERRSLSNSGTGIDIADGHFSVAELVNGNCLFIHIDLASGTNQTEELLILERVVDEVISILDLAEQADVC